MERRLGSRNVVLLGIGHTHAHLVKQWAMHPIPDLNLICVTDFPTATYSGMLPGVLAGDYSPAQMEIDLVRLLSVAKVQWFQDELASLDRQQGLLRFKSGRQIRYDLLSVGVGSRPLPLEVRPSAQESIPVVGIKPMQSFLERLESGVRIAQQQSQVQGRSRIQIDVVGGGLGSVEIVMCLRFFLHRCGLPPTAYQLRLISGAESPPVGCLPKTRQRVRRTLRELGIELLPSTKLVAVKGRDLILDHGAVLDHGAALESDLVVYLAAGHAASVTALFDLPKDERGCLLTNRRLESIADPRIWAGGDCGTIQNLNLPKAGVYAVRQGPVMWSNLERWAQGRPLQAYHPQHDFLKLINLGGRQAIGEWRGFSFQGRWVWHWKDRIDTGFMKMYQGLAEKLAARMGYTTVSNAPESNVTESNATESNAIMRCLGCGSKIASEDLRHVLQELQQASQDFGQGVFDTSSAHDDVALIRLGAPSTISDRSDQPTVAVSVDAFPAPVADPWLAGRLAVVHSLSDLWASGIPPQQVLATVEIPFGSPTAQRETLLQVMLGITHQLQLENVKLVGGHSLEGPRLSIALTVLGTAPAGGIPAPKQGLRPGDCLLLSKGLGTGVGLAALMQGRCPAQVYRPLIDSMLQSNRIALALIERFSVHAMTDVTGFGLLGHLHEMTGRAPVQVTLNMPQVRKALLPGILPLFEAGIRSTMHENNASFLANVEYASPAAKPLPQTTAIDEAALLDPQTSGGLLFSIPERQLTECLGYLHSQQLLSATVIGRVTEPVDSPSPWCVLQT